ncbi:MAG: hypothetical protein LBQ09_08350 [Acidobacteriaceae bacterium]|jgi:hypothetical protein|nr:hypothetical protein [Acidobacteriaceae bacterium]
MLTYRWQPLAGAVAFALLGYAGTARAQTVVVKGAAEGTPVELAVNATVVANGKADARGFATMTAPARQGAVAPIHTLVFVDRCAALRRVVIASQGATPIAAGGCVRQSMLGLFSTSSVTTFVVDVSGPDSVLAIAQGRPPASWMRTSEEDAIARAPFGDPPRGLVLFGGAGVSLVQDLNGIACGDAPTCSSDLAKTTLAGGVALWITPYLGIEASFVRPSIANATGSGTLSTGPAYQFNSALETNMATVTGLVAVPLNRVRLYARAGVNRHYTSLTTTNSIDAGTITLSDGTTQPTNGGTVSQEMRAKGLGWVVGGGVEVWLTHHFALYGDISNSSNSGNALDTPEGSLSVNPWLAMGGVRLRVF